MLKKSITYTDFNGEERTDICRFNLNKAELLELELSTTGGLSEHIQNIMDTKNGGELVKLFKKLILSSYGEVSADGKRFVKSEELSKAFSETPAYEILFMELATDQDAAKTFVEQVLPSVD